MNYYVFQYDFRVCSLFIYLYRSEMHANVMGKACEVENLNGNAASLSISLIKSN